MRIDKELVYQEYKEAWDNAFLSLGRKHLETPKDVENWMSDEMNDLLVDDSVDLAFWLISLGTYELEHDMLRDEVYYQLCHYVPAVSDGEFDDDIFEEEREQLEKDIKYIMSKVTFVKVRKAEDN